MVAEARRPRSPPACGNVALKMPSIAKLGGTHGKRIWRFSATRAREGPLPLMYFAHAGGLLSERLPADGHGDESPEV